MTVTELPLLRQSERSAFKRCNWAWYQEYVKNRRPISETGTEAADFGTLFHVCMAEYYLPGIVRGVHPAETWERLAKEVVAAVKTTQYENDELVAKWEDFYELGLDLAEAYVENYRGDPHWHVLDAERRFDVVIPDVRYKPLISEKGRRGYRPIVILVGTFDLCIRDLNDNSIKMVDHKTVATIETYHLTLDEQASTYISVGTNALRHQGLIGDKESIKGMEYNFIKRAALDNRPRDEKGLARNKPQKKHYIEALDKEGMSWAGDPMKKSLAELAELADGLTVYGEVSADQSSSNFMRFYVPRSPKERQRQIVRISEEARVMDDVRHGRLPLLKTPTKTCNWCKFFDMCELDESGGDVDYFVETTMKTFDPYADHRENALNSKKVNEGIEAGDGRQAERSRQG